MIEAASDAHSARNHNDLQNAMNHMLWILAEGTRYEHVVGEAFSTLEKFHDLIRKGQMGNQII